MEYFPEMLLHEPNEALVIKISKYVVILTFFLMGVEIKTSL